jgi:hypothetical protein
VLYSNLIDKYQLHLQALTSSTKKSIHSRTFFEKNTEGPLNTSNYTN